MAEISEGIDRRAIADWLSQRVPVCLPLEFSAIEGGRSNLTYLIADSENNRWVLRRPPLHSVLPSAHDMSRESTVMSALRTTEVPVPSVLGYEPDESLIGSEFYVMEYVPGMVIRDLASSKELLSQDDRRRAGLSLIDVLARLHRVDVDEVGLSTFGQRHGYIKRQLSRWRGQLEKGRTRELEILYSLHSRLARDIPVQESSAIVHGDYRLDNVILDNRGEVCSVLDWELCTLGDPLADVGLFAVYWSNPEDEMVPLLSAPTKAEGFHRREDLLAAYARKSERNLEELDFYVAFGYWKLAIILEGVYSRFKAGAYGDIDDSSYERFPGIVQELAERAHDAAGRAGR